MDNYDIIAIVMLFVGLALLIAEVFVPSGGMITILAVVCIAVSVWAAHQAWWETDRGIWWSYLAVLLLLAPGSIGGSLYMLQRTGLGRQSVQWEAVYAGIKTPPPDRSSQATAP